MTQFLKGTRKNISWKVTLELGINSVMYISFLWDNIEWNLEKIISIQRNFSSHYLFIHFQQHVETVRLWICGNFREKTYNLFIFFFLKGKKNTIHLTIPHCVFNGCIDFSLYFFQKHMNAVKNSRQRHWGK